MNAVEPPDRTLRAPTITEDKAHRGVDRGLQAAERGLRKVAVLRHALSHVWVRDLKQQCRRTGTQQDGLAVDAPHHRSRAVEAQ